MIDRFQGERGKSLLINELRKQTTIQGDLRVAKELSEVAEIVNYTDGEILISEGGSDNFILFILAGKVLIKVRNVIVAEFFSHQHIGEMAMLDPSAPRSATVISKGHTLVAKVTEMAFSEIANRHSFLWRNIAVEIASRLCQLNNLVQKANDSPRVFIGCSTEALNIANEIQNGLANDNMIVKTWTNNVFLASNFPIEDLETQLEESDFGILLLTPDDTILSRNKIQNSPRDNIILELGLFLGKLTRRRTIIVSPRDVEIKLPSDLLGINRIQYKTGEARDISALIAPACTQIRNLVSRRGTRTNKVCVPQVN